MYICILIFVCEYFTLKEDEDSVTLLLVHPKEESHNLPSVINAVLNLYDIITFYDEQIEI